VDTYDHDGLTFDVTDTGPVDGRPVILLHGFPEDRYCWDQLAAVLAGAGYRVLAPDQRGYSPGAVPPSRRSYTLDLLAGDVLALADAAGIDGFDVVGHDWGASVAWYLAARNPDRVRSLTALSVPQMRAMFQAMVRSDQALRSWYVMFFQVPRLPELLLCRAGEGRFAAQLVSSGLDDESARRYARRAASPAGLTGPLNWYRAVPFELGGPSHPITVPTLFVWGERDRFVTQAAAELCAQHVSGPFRFVPLPGGTHWLPTGSAREVAPLLLDHLAGATD
jgi:pimeloyl-ACP methyl ester carboxylesterase